MYTEPAGRNWLRYRKKRSRLEAAEIERRQRGDGFAQRLQVHAVLDARQRQVRRERGGFRRGTPSAAVARSVSAASASRPGASMPHQKTRGACGLGKNPTRRTWTAMGARGSTAASAAFNSSSRASGHSPMNLVVMCRLAGGLQ